MSIIIPANSATGGGYEVSNSLRFNSGSSDYLNRTLGTPTLATKNTLSIWFKKAKLGADQSMILGNGNQGGINLHNDDGVVFYNAGGSLRTNRKLRDTSAWYNLVVVTDTTLNTATDRLKMYINGVRQTSFSSSGNPSQNAASNLGSATAHNIGVNNSPANYFNGYMSEFVFIDGTALDPTSFGEFDEDSSIWKPKNVSGLTFGTNGFYLKFGNSGALGTDSSGEGNTFAVNNLTAIDQSTDTCTNNFATMNPLDNYWQGSAFSEGSLTVTTTNASQSYNTSSIMVSSGKWYVECKPVSGGSEPEIGIFSKLTGANAGNNSQLSYNANGYAYRASDPGSVWYNGSAVSTSFSQYANGDIVGIALDLDNNKLYFSKNGTFGNSGNPTSGSTGTGAISIVAPTSTTLGAYGFAANENFNDQNKVFSWNFGSPPYAISSGNTDGNDHGNFEYAVPSGYLALCTKNLSEVDS